MSDFTLASMQEVPLSQMLTCIFLLRNKKNSFWMQPTPMRTIALNN